MERPPDGAPSRWRRRYWAGIPLLAVVAYLTVLRVGFLSDDFVLLYQAQISGFDPSVFVPQPHWFLYRPAGTVLVWQVGWQLWGFNPLPFHVQSLLLHAGASLFLGLWLATATRRRALGWLAGALFAVFPLHLEAVAWVAAQWDTMAVFLGLLSLWLFTVWWLGSSRQRLLVYIAALLSYGLAIFTKESMLAFLPVFAFSAWLARPQFARREWVRLVLGLLPFAAVLGLNVGIRLAFWGHLGGYASTPISYLDVLPVAWDRLIDYTRLLLSPLNSTIFGPAVSEMVGIAVSVLILLGLIFHGSRQWRGLLVAGGWLVLALVPVLALPISGPDLQNNRFLYLAAAGYCVVLALLINSAFTQLGCEPRLGTVSIGVLLLACVALCWVQLSPWAVATEQVQNIEGDLGHLLPQEPASRDVTLYVENLPDNYEGAYLLRLGMGATRHFQQGNRLPAIETVADVSAAPLATEAHDAFALSFAWDPAKAMYEINSGDGITDGAGDSPVQARSGDNANMIWPFDRCSQGQPIGWKAINARFTCTPGEVLTVTPDSVDPQIVSTDLHVPADSAPAKWLRVAAEIRYVPGRANGRYFAQWFWGYSTGGFNARQSVLLPLRADGNWHDYWAFISNSVIGAPISTLRFDPVNAKASVEVRWIALDEVR